MADTAPSQSITGNTSYPQRLFMTLVVVVLALLIWHTLHIILLIFAGIIFAVFLRNNGKFLAEKTGMKEGWGITIVILVLLILLTVALFFMVPQVADQADELSTKLPETWDSLKENVSDTAVGGWLLRRMPSADQLASSVGGLMKKATSWLYSAVGAISGILIILALGIYGSYDADMYINGTKKLVPKRKRDRARRTLHGVGTTLYWWLIGRLVSMLIIGIFTFIGLWFMGMPLALTLAVFAAVMTFIPNIGPVISVIPAVILALGSQDGVHAGYVVALYAGIQMVESYLITPLVQRQIISMPPALILSAQIIMGVIQGVIGILLAVPLVAVIIVLVKLLYIEDVLEDHDIHIQAEDREKKARN